MSDAKELIAGLRRATRHVVARDARNGAHMGDYYEPDEHAQRGADWIERWAPVIEALTAYELLRQAYEHWEARGGRTYGPPPNSYQDRYMAKKRLRFAINAALMEDKP